MVCVENLKLICCWFLASYIADCKALRTKCNLYGERTGCVGLPFVKRRIVDSTRTTYPIYMLRKSTLANQLGFIITAGRNNDAVMYWK